MTSKVRNLSNSLAHSTLSWIGFSKFSMNWLICRIFRRFLMKILFSKKK